MDVDPRDTSVTSIGGEGGSAGITSTDVEYGLVPSAVVCATRNWYGVERVRPVIVIDVDADIPSTSVVQFVPSVEYWMV
jgi:hypothetical protein